MADQHLNSAQVQQLQKQAQEQVEAYITRLNLRKWAVEQAFSRVSLASEGMGLAKLIYDFTVQPVKLELGS
jgi:hypothetical protein